MCVQVFAQRGRIRFLSVHNKMSFNYFRSFIIGTSILVPLHFLMAVMNIPENKRTFSYDRYSIIAPLYFGLVNALSLYILGSNKYRFLITGLFSGLFVYFFIAKRFTIYKDPDFDWNSYFVRIILRHILTFVVIIQTLEYYV